MKQPEEELDYYEYELDSNESNTNKDSNYTTLNWPAFYLNRSLDQIMAIKVLEVSIPYVYAMGNFFEIKKFNSSNVLVSQENYIFSGYFDTYAECLTYLEAELLLVTGLTYTLSVNSVSKMLTITNNDATFGNYFTMSFTENPRLFGFPEKNIEYQSSASDSINGCTLTSTFTPVYFPLFFYVNSVTLGSLFDIFLPSNSRFGNTNSTLGPQIAKVPISNTIFGSVTNWIDPCPERWFTTKDFNLTGSVDFFISNSLDPFTVLDLKGLSFSIKLGILRKVDSFDKIIHPDKVISNPIDRPRPRPTDLLMEQFRNKRQKKDPTVNELPIPDDRSGQDPDTSGQTPWLPDGFVPNIKELILASKANTKTTTQLDYMTNAQLRDYYADLPPNPVETTLPKDPIPVETTLPKDPIPVETTLPKDPIIPFVPTVLPDDDPDTSFKFVKVSGMSKEEWHPLYLQQKKESRTGGKTPEKWHADMLAAEGNVEINMPPLEIPTISDNEKNSLVTSVFNLPNNKLSINQIQSINPLILKGYLKNEPNPNNYKPKTSTLKNYFSLGDVLSFNDNYFRQFGGDPIFKYLNEKKEKPPLEMDSTDYFTQEDIDRLDGSDPDALQLFNDQFYELTTSVMRDVNGEVIRPIKLIPGAKLTQPYFTAYPRVPGGEVWAEGKKNFVNDYTNWSDGVLESLNAQTYSRDAKIATIANYTGKDASELHQLNDDELEKSFNELPGQPGFPDDVQYIKNNPEPVRKSFEPTQDTLQKWYNNWYTQDEVNEIILGTYKFDPNKKPISKNDSLAKLYSPSDIAKLEAALRAQKKSNGGVHFGTFSIPGFTYDIPYILPNPFEANDIVQSFFKGDHLKLRKTDPASPWDDAEQLFQDYHQNWKSKLPSTNIIKNQQMKQNMVKETPRTKERVDNPWKTLPPTTKKQDTTIEIASKPIIVSKRTIDKNYNLPTRR